MSNSDQTSNDDHDRGAPAARAGTDVAAHIEHAATHGSISVSRAVRDMLTAGDLEYVDRGDHGPTGMDGSMRLYELV